MCTNKFNNICIKVRNLHISLVYFNIIICLDLSLVPDNTWKKNTKNVLQFVPAAKKFNKTVYFIFN